MTLNEAIKFIYKATIAVYINGEKYTYEQFQRNTKHWFTHSEKLILEICMPDGRWLAKISKLKNGEFGTYIPETRKQENQLYRELGIKSAES